MEKKIEIDGLVFKPLISYQAIKRRTMELAADIKQKYDGHSPLLIGVLHGSFMFLANLIKHLDCSAEVDFVKLTSYHGEKSVGRIKKLLDVDIPVTDRDVILVEDIVDSGLTLKSYIEELQLRKPRSISVATLLYKPEKCQESLPLDFVGFEIAPLFVVGHGLDYNHKGRTLKDIYIKEE